jgi:hypothetical protein
MSDVELNGGTVWICEDCYFAHHYGRHEHEGQWFSGESDEPCEHEPLAFLQDVRLFDNYDESEGFETFSTSDCPGCRSGYAGGRFRMTWREV